MMAKKIKYTNTKRANAVCKTAEPFQMPTADRRIHKIEPSVQQANAQQNPLSSAECVILYQMNAKFTMCIERGRKLN